MKDAFSQYRETVISQELKMKIINHIEASSRTQEKGAMREHKYNEKSKRYDTRNKIQHVYAQNEEVCLLNDVENMVVSMDAQTIPNVHSL